MLIHELNLERQGATSKLANLGPAVSYSESLVITFNTGPS
jgi:hypothetical protein